MLSNKPNLFDATCFITYTKLISLVLKECVKCYYHLYNMAPLPFFFYYVICKYPSLVLLPTINTKIKRRL